MTSCSFTFEHYRDILQDASAIFEFSGFTRKPDDTRRLYLRHDVDVSMENAVAMAELEAEMGVESTYFVAINSPYYNVFNDSQLRRVRRLAKLGHTVGLHLDERGAYMEGYDDIESGIEAVHDLLSDVAPVEKVISFHMPSEYEFTRTDAIGEFVNAYSTTFNDDEVTKYLSDSNRRWREGCFCEYLKDLEYHSYQVLVHPIWWNEWALSDEELFEKLQTTTQEGLEVNLKNDIGIFADL